MSRAAPISNQPRRTVGDRGRPEATGLSGGTLSPRPQLSARAAGAALATPADTLLERTEALRQRSLKQRFERGFVFELEATTFVLEAARLFFLAPLNPRRKASSTTDVSGCRAPAVSTPKAWTRHP